MNARRYALTALVSLLSLAGGVSFCTPLAMAEEACKNAQFRTGYAANLPDCRAYELVSPPGTAPLIELGEGRYGATNDIGRGARMPGAAKGATASVSGERLAFTSKYAPAGSASDSQYFLSSRGLHGWSTVDMTPPQTTEYGVICTNAYVIAYSPELSSSILGDGYGQTGSGHYNELCGTDDPPLVENEPQGYQNLFFREAETSPYQLVDVTPSNVQPADAWFQAASSDLTHVVFDEKAKLTPEAPAEAKDLYEWSGGVVRLVTFLPDGTPVAGSLVNADEPEVVLVFTYMGPEIFTHAVSTDGSRVFFYANGNLYVRENAYEQQSALDAKGRCSEPKKACTVQLDASHAGGPGGGGMFMWASADGSKAFFADEASAGLSGDTQPGSGQNLYECRLVQAEEGPRCDLSDLTPSGDARVLGVSGVGEAGTYVYFVAEGALTGAPNSAGNSASASQPNLYVAHDGNLAFVATLDASYDNTDWDLKSLTARVSPNGEFIAFDSLRSLTGYANTPVQPGDCHIESEALPCTEIFLYDAVQEKLSCVSCDPSGAPPTAPAALRQPEHDWFDGEGSIKAPGYLQRNVTDEGLVFFDTAEALAPRATNGQTNVYEYQDGQTQLISTATSNAGSYFYEASSSGNDLFLTSSQPLAPGVAGSEYSVYDARVDGGFPVPENLTACSEEDCKGALTATPLLAPPSSETFVDTGNRAQASVVHKATKRVKHKPKKKRHVTKGKHKKGAKRSRARRSVRSDHGGVK